MNANQKILRREINQGAYPSLNILENTTGSGKNYAIEQVIVDEFIAHPENLSIYVTTRRNNRDQVAHEIKMALPKNERKKVLVLRSVPEQVVDFINKIAPVTDEALKSHHLLDNQAAFTAHIKHIAKDKKYPKTLKLLTDISYEYFSACAFKSCRLTNLPQSLQEKIYTIKHVIGMEFFDNNPEFKKEHTSDDERTSQLLADLPWYEKLFPDVRITNKTCLVMTDIKLITGYRTFYGYSKEFWKVLDKRSDNKYQVNLFIDESDAVKKDWTSYLINQVAGNDNRPEDLITVFERIKDALDLDKLPIEFLDTKGAKEILKSVKRRLDKIEQRYHLQVIFELDDKIDDNKAPMIFNFGEENIYAQSGKNDLVVTFKKDQNINLITKKSNLKDGENYWKLSKLLKDVRKAISMFIKRMYTFADAYYNQNKLNPTEDNSEKVLYVLNTLIPTTRREDRYLQHYLLDVFDSKRDAERIPGLKANFSVDDSHYSKGYSYVKVDSNRSESMRSKVYLYAEKYSAEDFLQKMANKWRVFLISGTSENDSVLSNFDLRWLELNVKHYKVLNDEMLDKENERQIEQFNSKVKVDTEILGYKLDKLNKKEYFAELIGKDSDKNLYTEYLNKFPVKEEKDRDFHLSRDLNLFKVIIKMCKLHKEDHSLQSFIIYRNAKIDDNKLEFINHLLEEADLSEYAEKIEDVRDKWSQGQFGILLTTYNSLNRGVNLQYTISKTLKDSPQLVNINSSRQGKEKDLDGVYLERPTHLNHGHNFDGENCANETLHVLSEVDGLVNHGDVTLLEAYKLISTYFTQGKLLINRDSYPVLVNEEVILEQALGRMMRTNWKNKNMYVFLTEDSEKCLLTIKPTHRVTGLMRQILDKLGQSKRIKPREVKSLVEINNCNKFIRDFAHNLSHTNEKMRKQWVEVREYIGAHPQLDDLDTDMIVNQMPMLANFYCTFDKLTNKYYYSFSDNDFVNLTGLSLDKTEQATKLLDFSQYNEMLKKIFAKNRWLKNKLADLGYMTDLSEPHKYLVTPTAFNNLYKGIIGEKIFTLVAEKYHLPWHEMEELSKNHFELMDGFFQKPGKITYVDVKNYDSHKKAYIASQGEFDQKEMGKIERLEDGKNEIQVLIVNLYDWENVEYPVHRQDKITYYPALFSHNGTLNEKVIEEIENKVGRM